MSFDYIGFLSKSFPSEVEVVDFCNRLRSAGKCEVESFIEMLSGSFGLEAKRLPIWCDRFLRKSNSAELLDLTIIAAKRSVLFNDLHLSDLFDVCLKFYSSGVISVNVLEAHWAGLVDSMNLNSKTTYGNPFYAIGRGLSISDDKILKSVSMPRLDASLAKHASNYDNCFYEDSVINSLSWMVHSLNIPQTFYEAAGFYQYRKDPSRLMLLLERIMKHGQITSEQLNAIVNIYGVGQTGESYLRVISYNPKISDIYTFTDSFDEKSLFSTSGLKSLKKEVSVKRSLAIYDILADKDFDSSKLPIFVNFVLDSTRDIYRTFTINDPVRRSAVRRLNVDNDRHQEVWQCEIEYYARHIDNDRIKLDVSNPVEILSALKVKRPQEYRLALKAINEIGIRYVGGDLASADNVFISDFLKEVKISHREKVEFMKVFPISKPLILEDDLGM